MLILLLLSYLAIFVAAGYRLYIDRNSKAIAIVVVALVYGMISLTCVARLAGVLPSPRGGLLEQAFPYINTYWQGSTAMAVYLFLSQQIYSLLAVFCGECGYPFSLR